MIKINKNRLRIYAIAVALPMLILAALIYFVFSNHIASPRRGSPEIISRQTAETLAFATCAYIYETGKIPPLDARLSKILFGKNKFDYQYLSSTSPTSKEGFFLDAYKHPFSVEIKSDEVIVKNSAGEVLATEKIQDKRRAFLIRYLNECD